MSATAQKTKRPGNLTTCSIPDGRNIGGTCKWPIVPSAEIPLCARHILIAANAHKQLGGKYLTSIVIAEEHK